MTARLQAVHRLPDLEHRNLTKEKAPQGATVLLTLEYPDNLFFAKSALLQASVS
jgi:hypothetical protein